MKRSISIMFAAAIVAVAATNAWAGFRSAQQVVINTTTRIANGDLGYVYNTADRTQYIGCDLHSTSSTSSATCYAKNAAGTYVSCYTTNAYHLNTIRALTSDSHLIFYWDTYGTCTNITVRNGSQTAPKAP